MSVGIPTMPRPSEDDLEKLAAIVGARLPASYTDFVGQHDGAAPEGNSIVTRDNEVDSGCLPEPAGPPLR